MPKDLSAQQVGQQIRSKASSPKQHVFTGRSSFPMSYDMPNTYRYGHIQPFYYQHTIGDDDIPLFSEHQLSTFTLASPVKADVRMNKSYFLVDYKAIYPRNWDLMYVAPKKGDDVPANTRCITTNLISSLSSRLTLFKQFTGNFEQGAAVDFMRFVFLLESVFSAGSLFTQFNIHLQGFVRTFSSTDTEHLKPKSFDTWFDTFFVDIIKDSSFVLYDKNGDSYRLSDDGTSYYNSDNDSYYVSIRRLIEIMRSQSFTVRYLNNDLVRKALDNISIIGGTDLRINLEIIAAYQLGCAQFFTDSNVDYAYSADLLRKTLEQIYLSIRSNVAEMVFNYNGNRMLYDAFSGFILDQQLQSIATTIVGAGYISVLYNWFSVFFNHRNSLRFGDYFVSGRISPYGTGDLTVDTSQANVSVVDITRMIQLQRFWNKVNVASQKIGEYARNVMGLSDADDNSFDIPAYLGHKTLNIGSMEIENTGSQQRDANAITSVLKATQNVHAFDIHTKRPGIIIGVMTFDVPRIYSLTIDKMHMHLNRYDDYIPAMQFVGDQPIYQRELDATHPVNGIFAYTTRYMEYKTRYSYAAGGAIDVLKSWYFITDNKDGNPFNRNIDPDYIRSQPSEFDRFYSSLTGYSLGTYFHFNVKNRNYQELTRDMFVSPQPLM